ncbi:MAG: twin-arginine translocation signal domain-containing protein [Acetobacteraceae bacterium]|nr:twin-arginine translocation signal domain-containing protein [Acetobacteraceae bacterium]MDW8397210.1 twin-arginine translocation signal domain-containing protein [Acetobacteraceae bacterium]
MSEKNETGREERRGFLKALGLGVGMAAAAVAPAAAQTSPPARKENAQERTAARYQPNSPHVQAFYRTNRGG